MRPMLIYGEPGETIITSQDQSQMARPQHRGQKCNIRIVERTDEFKPDLM